MSNLAIAENDASLDANIQATLAMARKNPMEMQRLALDCTRMLRCVEENGNNLASQGFLKRLWARFSGQQGKIAMENQQAFAMVQRMSFRYLEKVHEENLMTLNAVATVKNQLAYAVSDLAEIRTETGKAVENVYGAIDQLNKETADQISRLRESTKAAIFGLAMKMKERLDDMENRIERLETSTAIHGWLLTFEEFGYNRYPQAVRLVEIVSQYRMFKNKDWTADDARYLKSALRRGGLDPHEPILVRDFIQQLALENYPDTYGTDIRNLLQIPLVDADKVRENVSLPALNSLYMFAKEYAANQGNIQRLAKRHANIDPREELATQITEILDEYGIEANASAERHHFAMELLTGIEIAQAYGWTLGYQCPEAGCVNRVNGKKSDNPGICTQCGNGLVQVQ